MTWEPIETMPDTGEQVLFYMPGGIFIGPAAKFHAMPRDQRLKLAMAGDWPDHRKWRPTHWMPLPTPPGGSHD